MDKEEVLQLGTRRKIYELILNSPGIHYREIERKLNLSPGVMEYQLKILEKQELIVKKKQGYFTRYFVRDKISSKEKNMISQLRQRIPRDIVIYIILHPNSCNKDILTEINIPRSTLSYHARKLVKADILTSEVQGRNTCYTVKDPKLVIKLITTYRSSFFDEMTDRLTELWDEIF